MKCKHCDGTGNIANGMWLCCECQGTGFIEDEKPSETMTNDEWRKTCSTEEFAEFLNLIIRVGPYENEPKDFWEHVYGRGGDRGTKSIVEWLKKPHTPKE